MLQAESIKLMKKLIKISKKAETKKFNSLQEGLSLASVETEILQELFVALGSDIRGRNPRFFNPFLF